MKKLAIVLGLNFVPILAFSQLTGRWEGTHLMGPSKIAQTMDGDQLYKLQVSKAFMKTLKYELDLKPDGTFQSKVTGLDMEAKRGKGTYAYQGEDITLAFKVEQGIKSSRVLSGKISADKRRFVLLVPSKPGLPQSKFVFQRPKPAQTR